MTTTKSIIIGTAANRRPAPRSERRAPSPEARDHARTPVASEADPCIIHGDCIETMRAMEAGSVDFILTDPPYITRYRDRSGRSVANDDNGDWLLPSVRQMFRVLKNPGL